MEQLNGFDPHRITVGTMTTLLISSTVLLTIISSFVLSIVAAYGAICGIFLALGHRSEPVPVRSRAGSLSPAATASK